MGLSSSLLTTVIAYVVWGTAEASLTGLARSALIMDSVPKQRLASGFGAFLQLAGLIAAASPLIGSLFLLQTEQYIIFVIGALLTLGSTVVRALLLRDAPMKADATGNKTSNYFSSLKAGLSSIVRSRTVLVLTLAYAFYNLFLSNGYCSEGSQTAPAQRSSL